MAEFRKKPVVIEARQWAGGAEAAPPIIDWILTGERCASWDDQHTEDGWIAIETLEGTMIANPGDWIIKGVAGEFYPCKPGIFAATYEPVAVPVPADRETDGERVRELEQFVAELGVVYNVAAGTDCGTGRSGILNVLWHLAWDAAKLLGAPEPKRLHDPVPAPADRETDGELRAAVSDMCATAEDLADRVNHELGDYPAYSSAMDEIHAVQALIEPPVPAPVEGPIACSSCMGSGLHHNGEDLGACLSCGGSCEASPVEGGEA